LQRPLIHEAQKHDSTQKDAQKEALTKPEFQKRHFPPRCSSKGGEKVCSAPFFARASARAASAQITHHGFAPRFLARHPLPTNARRAIQLNG
jgi:hypothetical protein